MERSWPTDPARVETSEGRAEVRLTRATAIRARVDEAMQVNANAALEQPGITGAEALALEAVTASISIVDLLATNNALVASMSSRVGILSMQIAEVAALIADQNMATSNALQMDAFAQQMVTGGDREPSPVGRLPGVPSLELTGSLDALETIIAFLQDSMADVAAVGLRLSAYVRNAGSADRACPSDHGGRRRDARRHHQPDRRGRIRRRGAERLASRGRRVLVNNSER
jgi:hypothetical protein